VHPDCTAGDGGSDEVGDGDSDGVVHAPNAVRHCDSRMQASPSAVGQAEAVAVDANDVAVEVREGDAGVVVNGEVALVVAALGPPGEALHVGVEGQVQAHVGAAEPVIDGVGVADTDGDEVTDRDGEAVQVPVREAVRLPDAVDVAVVVADSASSCACRRVELSSAAASCACKPATMAALPSTLAKRQVPSSATAWRLKLTATA